MEFLDIMELEAIVTSKELWKKFENYFHNKDAVKTKFIQFSDLRNSLFHNRTLNSITRKEGEAAIDWFSNILKEI